MNKWESTFWSLLLLSKKKTFLIENSVLKCWKSLWDTLSTHPPPSVTYYLNDPLVGGWLRYVYLEFSALNIKQKLFNDICLSFSYQAVGL